MESKLETGGYQISSFQEMILFYEKGGDDAMKTLSDFLARLWKEFH